ncbi:MAG: hypothetical protein ACT4PU_13270 [Planctomycetota bacterium]
MHTEYEPSKAAVSRRAGLSLAALRSALLDAGWKAALGAGVGVCAGACTEAPAAVQTMRFEEAQPVLALHRRGSPTEAEWPAWIAERKADVSARLQHGDEDSVVNFLLFGTSFTSAPRAVTPDSAGVRARLLDLTAALAGPSEDERLSFVRSVLARSGLDPRRAADQPRIRSRLAEFYANLSADLADYERALEAVPPTESAESQAQAYAGIFQERGLSSDTSLVVDCGLAQVLAVLAEQGRFAPGSVRRVALVGPGLDFTNKVDGHDFYAQQSIQPFALMDTLLRLGLAVPGRLELTTLDVSPRVNAHLSAAVERARQQQPYQLVLPLPADEPWTQPTLEFWAQLGAQIGRELPPLAAPAAAGALHLRALSVAPQWPAALRPVELNLVFERLAPAALGEGFDLLVATNVLLYYDAFERSLALANGAAMLRPGGILLTNTAALHAPPLAAGAHRMRVLYSARRHDDFYWYQRE